MPCDPPTLDGFAQFESGALTGLALLPQAVFALAQTGTDISFIHTHCPKCSYQLSRRCDRCLPVLL